MSPFGNESVAAPTTDSNILLLSKTGFGCEDGGGAGHKAIGQHQPGQRQKFAICCSISLAVGAAMMIGLLIAGPLIKHTIVASNVTERTYRQSSGKFMMPQAKPSAGHWCPGAFSRRPAHEMPSRFVTSGMHQGAVSGNEHSELTQMEADGEQEFPDTVRVRIWRALAAGDELSLPELSRRVGERRWDELKVHLYHVDRQARTVQNKKCEWKLRRGLPATLPQGKLRLLKRKLKGVVYVRLG